MNRARMRAARLAVFLECAGVVPIVRGSNYREHCRSLEQHYCGLDIEVRRRARVEGRRRLREMRAETAALRLILIPLPLPIPPNLRRNHLRRLGAQYRRRMLRWPAGTLPCPRCRMAPNLLKPAYPNRELAEAVRARQNDPRLHVYPWPGQPGFWHLGHKW